MRRRLALIMIAAGALLVLSGMGGLMGPARVSAQAPAPQPSPRPPASLDEESDRVYPPATGRVTGTVIDEVSGAPLAGVKVVVGPDTVVTDANGNYDHWLPAGTYSVMVMPDAAGAAVVQLPAEVTVVVGEVTVQHLSVRLPAAVVPRAAAPVMAADTDAAADLGAPRSLPRTGIEVDDGIVWVALGLMLLMLGWFLWGRPVARLAPALSRPSRLPAGFDRNAMLAGLLDAKRPAPSDDALLDELLARDRE